MNERERLMQHIATIDFAITELHLYLDTHPDAQEITEKLIKYKHKSNMLKQEYEDKYGPITSSNSSTNNWGWISNPWPWDIEEECE